MLKIAVASMACRSGNTNSRLDEAHLYRLATIDLQLRDCHCFDSRHHVAQNRAHQRSPKSDRVATLKAMAQAVRQAFAAGAESYDRARRKLIPCFDDFYRTALELLPFQPDDRFEVLDLGAGTGLLSAMIAEAFPKARLTLFDVTLEMLMIARQRLKPLGKRVRFVTADFAAAAPAKAYDAVVSALAIYHLPDSGKRH